MAYFKLDRNMPSRVPQGARPLTAFSADGTFLAIASSDGRLKTFDTGFCREPFMRCIMFRSASFPSAAHAALSSEHDTCVACGLQVVGALCSIWQRMASRRPAGMQAARFRAMSSSNTRRWHG